MNHAYLETAGADQAMEGRINSFELAFRMQMAMPDAQDVSKESQVTRKLYGMDNPITENFGRQCLMARRFLERGVRFVQVTHSDSKVQWDQHGNLYKGHSKNAAEVDKPSPACCAICNIAGCWMTRWSVGQRIRPHAQRRRPRRPRSQPRRLHHVVGRGRSEGGFSVWGDR